MIQTATLTREEQFLGSLGTVSLIPERSKSDV